MKILSKQPLVLKLLCGVAEKVAKQSYTAQLSKMPGHYIQPQDKHSARLCASEHCVEEGRGAYK